ncbi:MAG: hypothetical protein WCJ55_16815 [Chloroflexales bacterium]
MGSLPLLSDASGVVIIAAAHPEVMRLHGALAAHLYLYAFKLG